MNDVGEQIKLWFGMHENEPSTDERQLLNDAAEEIDRLNALIDSTAKVWLDASLGIPWDDAIDVAMAAAVAEIKMFRRAILRGHFRYCG
jgi:hypothetical protein